MHLSPSKCTISECSHSCHGPVHRLLTCLCSATMTTGEWCSNLSLNRERERERNCGDVWERNGGLCALAHAHIHGWQTAWAGVTTGSYIINSWAVALFWTWVGTKRVNVRIEDLRALSHLLGTHEGETHSCSDTVVERGVAARTGEPPWRGKPLISTGYTADDGTLVVSFNTSW